jgi:hypothetical protein
MSVMSIASSGMRAASLGVQAAASNVARLPVTETTRLGVAQTAAAGGGVTATVVAAPDHANAPIADLLTAREAALAFAGNATVVRRLVYWVGPLVDGGACCGRCAGRLGGIPSIAPVTPTAPAAAC